MLSCLYRKNTSVVERTDQGETQPRILPYLTCKRLQRGIRERLISAPQVPWRSEFIRSGTERDTWTPINRHQRVAVLLFLYATCGASGRETDDELNHG